MKLAIGSTKKNTFPMQLEKTHSLERIYPIEMNPESQNDLDSIEIHTSRYDFASRNLVGSEILDMACGCGFGTAQMAKDHPDKQFTGIDIDPMAIEYANSHYRLPNLKYVCADAMTYDAARYDSIVSLETIEHLPRPKEFIQNLSCLVNSNGRIIASVPVTPTCDGNPHHLHDFTVRSFKKLFSNVGFSMTDEFKQVQNWVMDDAFSSNENSDSRSQGVGLNVMAYYKKHPLALLTRIKSLMVHGRCNIYLTGVFETNKESQ